MTRKTIQYGLTVAHILGIFNSTYVLKKTLNDIFTLDAVNLFFFYLMSLLLTEKLLIGMYFVKNMGKMPEINIFQLFQTF
jgi:hypothetical protein